MVEYRRFQAAVDAAEFLSYRLIRSKIKFENVFFFETL